MTVTAMDKAKDSDTPPLTAIQKAQSVAHDPNHDPLWRINSLPTEVYDRTYGMLKQHSPRTIAELLQEEGYHTDIKAVTLSHILERFRSAKIPKHQLLNVYVVERLTTEVRKQVNIFSELSDLIELQSMRIRKAVLNEEESGELSGETNRLLHLQSRMLKIYADVAVKGGMMDNFIQSFTREAQSVDNMVTRETKDMFLRYFMYKLQGGGLEECLVDITNSPAPLE